MGRKRKTYPSLLDEHQVWHLTGNRVAYGSNPGGGGIFPPFFGPLVVSLRSGYLKAAGKPSVLQKFLVHMSSVHLICCTEKQLIITTWGEPHHMRTTVHLSSFIIAWYVIPYLAESHLSGNNITWYDYVNHITCNTIQGLGSIEIVHCIRNYCNDRETLQLLLW